MVFLLKCAFVLGLVLFLLSAKTEPAPSQPAAKQAAVGAPTRRARPAAKETAAQESADPVAALARAGAERLAKAAADRCVAAPRDCLAVAEALRRMESRETRH